MRALNNEVTEFTSTCSINYQGHVTQVSGGILGNNIWT